MSKNIKNENIKIRNEEKADYRIVEEITRNAFWNLYAPGRDEHYLVHIMRSHKDFITELDLVVEMKKSLIFSFIIASLVIGLAIILIAAFTGFPWDRDGNAKGRAVNGTQEEKDANGAQSEEIPGNDLDEKNQPSIAGIQLYADREQVVEILGTGYQETFYEEAGHFPEPFVIWKYESGFEICIGKHSNKVFQVTATSPEGITNLGCKVGYSAKDVLETYRAKYVEPESIHGGKLLGVFKVEDGQAMIFDFNIEDGIVNQGEIDPDAKVERIILTYPAFIDDSF